LLAGAVFLALACGDGFRQDVLDCEEAVAKLERCCPNFDGGRVSCQYVSACGYTNYPGISTPNSQCIRGASCAMLIADKVCDRAQNLQSVTVSTTQGGDYGPSYTQVCP
jgi:hypothetical protein